MLLEHCSLEKGRSVADSLISHLNAYQLNWQGKCLKVGISIGVTAVNKSSKSTGELLSQADMACYVAKDLGRNRTHVYHAHDVDLSQHHGEMMRASDIRSALEHDRFHLYCQPIVALNNVTDGFGEHYEILLRMIDTDGQPVMPGSFIPAAERYGLMNYVDRWVIRTVLATSWPMFSQPRNVSFSINLSGTSLSSDEGLLEFVQQQLTQSPIFS